MKKYIVIDDYGRTPNVCNIILKLIDDIPQIKEVSVLMNFVNISFHEKLKLTKIQTSLHLNLTDNIIFKNISNKNLTFIKLLFLKRNNRKYIFNEIDKQIENYTKIYNVRKIDINSHQHVHTIPWIYSYLLKNEKINEIRYSNEKIFFVYKKINIFELLRNFCVLLILRMLNLFNKNRSNNIFFGVLYTNNMCKKIINHILYKNKNSNLHILLHPGSAIREEMDLFEENEFYKYFISKKREREKIALYEHNENINNH